MQNFRLLFGALGLLALLLTNSCNLINPDEPIPSYVHIEDYSVITDLENQGTAQHNIFDVWVVHNGIIIATVPIPCTVPVLQEKGNIVTIFPGIKENGTSTNRSIYPFFDGIELDLDFNPGAIDSFFASDIAFQYKPATKFLWLEDFENETVSLQEINPDSAPFQRIKNPNKVFEGNASLQVILTEKDSLLSLQSFNFFPGSDFNIGSPTFLEIHYKNEANLQIGFAYKSANNIIQYDQPHLYLRESDEWKKVYVKMTDQVALLADQAGIKVYFAALLPNDKEQAEILIDNIKLITFE
jgi:hypothetical protein